MPKIKKSQIVDTKTSKRDKDLKSLHTKKDIIKQKTKNILKIKGVELVKAKTITLNNENKKIRREKRLQVLNDKYQMKAVNKSNITPKGLRNLKNIPGNIIDIKDVKKVYTTKTLRFVALQKTSLSIKDGEFVVILGPSGSGKTTLLNVISGLDRSTEGDIVVNNVNVSSLTNKEMTLFRRKNIGFIFQSYNLLSSLNVEDNIEVGALLQDDKKSRISTSSLLKQLQISEIAKKNIYELSGGQQQRVSIARALAKGPKLIIGDEPTGALDTTTTAKVLQIFQNINKKNNTTVILVTHNPNIAKLANKVIYVKDGSIIEIKQQQPADAKDFKEI
ncbi:MAG: ABC transporter ATP-binding protein [Mycoplasma sp.]|nr:ABC transporter ATP-binding protein [Mycoplasma sp.]